MENTNKLTNLVQDAQIILAKHLEPLGPTEKQTLQDLYQLLDGPRSREAIAAAPVQAQEPDGDVDIESRPWCLKKGTFVGTNGWPDGWLVSGAGTSVDSALLRFENDGTVFSEGRLHKGMSIERMKVMISCLAAPAAQGDAVEPHPVHPRYQPCPPDIEDELGQLLLACDKAIEFLTVGPAIEVTEDVIKAMYESNVVKLIPKLKAVLESRVSVKYPFAMLASIHGSRITEPGSAPIDHLLAATGAIEISNDRMMQNFENYTANIDTLNIGPNTMPYLADIVIHMQRIMTTFGWTWDDVKLKARQQMAEHE